MPLKAYSGKYERLQGIISQSVMPKMTACEKIQVTEPKLFFYCKAVSSNSIREIFKSFLQIGCLLKTFNSWLLNWIWAYSVVPKASLTDSQHYFYINHEIKEMTKKPSWDSNSDCLIRKFAHCTTILPQEELIRNDLEAIEFFLKNCIKGLWLGSFQRSWLNLLMYILGTISVF